MVSNNYKQGEYMPPSIPKRINNSLPRQPVYLGFGTGEYIVYLRLDVLDLPLRRHRLRVGQTNPPMYLHFSRSAVSL